MLYLTISPNRTILELKLELIKYQMTFQLTPNRTILELKF